MTIDYHWRRDSGARIQGSRGLDFLKVQAPCIVRRRTGGFRLFYTAIGPEKPYPSCQGYILSAVSDDGVIFRLEPGIRVLPQPSLSHMSLRVLAPTVTECADGLWRMYFEARGSADEPTVICSAVSADMIHWEHEAGIRLRGVNGFGGPRYLTLPDGQGRLYCFVVELNEDGERISQSIVSAITKDGLSFELEPGCRIQDRQSEYDNAGITAAEVIPPAMDGGRWTVMFSVWEDVPTGTALPLHPSRDSDAIKSGRSENFAAASIAADMAGYRSRIFSAHSRDGLAWGKAQCLIEGDGYGRDGLDAVHAEDMSVIRLDDGGYRMYYAACDKHGNWRIASAVTRETSLESGCLSDS